MTLRVVIVQRRLTHYRVPFFNALRAELARRGLDLVLLVGQGTREEVAKNDAGSLPWAHGLPTYYAARGKLCWQNLKPYLHDADLVIVTQENKLLHNLPLLLNNRRRFRLAFWGHGANLQSDNPRGFRERIKRWTTRRVDWWFAYTKISADLVEAAGFRPERITTVNNAVDTVDLLTHTLAVTPEETTLLRERCGFGVGPVGVFVGSLYPEKRLNFLIESARAVREKIPNFALLIIGDGSEREKVRAWCEQYSWCRWVGAQHGRQKAAYLSVAQVMLNPGLVGLGILDSFVARVPVLTTSCGLHSPEIAYLNNGVNGLLTDDDLNSYVEACCALLDDAPRLAALRAACDASAKEYTVGNMARRFADGIAEALSMPSNKGDEHDRRSR